MDDRFRIVEFQNGERSIVDGENGQSMHSRIGPWTEANRIYAAPSRVGERVAERAAEAAGTTAGDGASDAGADDEPFTLWDVGMGTAANALAAIGACRAALPPGRSATLRIYSFEKHIDASRFAFARTDAFPFLRGWTDALAELVEGGRISRLLPGEGADGGLRLDWRFLPGDFYARMGEAAAPDLIYFDFYSPKAVRDLWTKERFKSVRERIGDRDCRLHTYSAATPVRLAMLLGGFYVGYGPRTEMKAESTIAATRFESLEDPLAAEWKRKLDLSPNIEEGADRAAGHAHPQWARVGAT